MQKSIKKIVHVVTIALCVAVYSQPANAASLKEKFTEVKELITGKFDLLLIDAVKDGSPRLTQFYLNIGANPEAPDAAGLNALDYAQKERVQANIYKKQQKFEDYGEILRKLEAVQDANLKKRTARDQ
jgi:hypothetical protein